MTPAIWIGRKECLSVEFDGRLAGASSLRPGFVQGFVQESGQIWMTW
jgi:hypothetical protein